MFFVFIQSADLFDIGHLSVYSNPGKTVLFQLFEKLFVRSFLF